MEDVQNNAEKGFQPTNEKIISDDPLATEVFNLTETASGELLPPDRLTTCLLAVRAWIRRIGAEEIGIERIPESMRTDQSPRDLFTLWMSANICTATLAFGTLGPSLFGLGWWDCFCTLLFFNLAGAIPPAMITTWGPKLGLRTMCAQRYSFGWWPAKFTAFVNLLNCIGWAMVNMIAGADILYDVGEGSLPRTVSVLLIGLAALIVGLFGYKWLHKYERYIWMPMLVCFIILAGFGAKHFVNVPMGTGSAEVSAILTFGTAIVGFSVSWATYAADFAVYIRSDVKPWVVFLWTWNGLFWSQFLVELLGVALMTTIQGSDPAFKTAFSERGVGGLVGQVFVGYGPGVRGFGKFIEVLLAFSTVAVVLTDFYSLALNVQLISDSLMKVPRLIWTFIGGAGAIIAAIAGRDHLQQVMEDFLNVIAYWLTPFLTIVALEHFCFRRNFAYDVSAWNDPRKLPYGIAAIVCFCIGTVLAILSMSQTWYVGPIALGVGNPPYGTDISWELALGATIVLYIPSRWLERRLTGK